MTPALVSRLAGVLLALALVSSAWVDLPSVTTLP